MTEFARLTQQINRLIVAKGKPRLSTYGNNGIIYRYDMELEHLKQQRRDLDPVQAHLIEMQARRRHLDWGQGPSRTVLTIAKRSVAVGQLVTTADVEVAR